MTMWLCIGPAWLFVSRKVGAIKAHGGLHIMFYRSFIQELLMLYLLHSDRCNFISVLSLQFCFYQVWLPFSSCNCDMIVIVSIGWTTKTNYSWIRSLQKGTLFFVQPLFTWRRNKIFQAIANWLALVVCFCITLKFQSPIEYTFIIILDPPLDL